MRSLQKEMKEEHATNVAAIQEAFKSLSGCAVKYEGNEYPGEVKAILINAYQYQVSDDSCWQKLEMAPATGQNLLSKEQADQKVEWANYRQ